MSGAEDAADAVEWEEADRIGFRLDELLTQRVSSLPRAVTSELRGYGLVLTGEQAERIAAGLHERWNSVLPEGHTAANMAAILRAAGIDVAPPPSADSSLQRAVDRGQMTLLDLGQDTAAGGAR